jgi:hypothetical protein
MHHATRARRPAKRDQATGRRNGPPLWPAAMVVGRNLQGQNTGVVLLPE